jgi:hypothetical protein
MKLDDLDRAVALRKKEASKKAVAATAAAGNNNNSNGTNANSAAADKLHFGLSQAEASYLLLAHHGGGSAAGSSALSTDNDYQRTGRWTEDEVAYTDFLVECFDSGKLPIEQGIKLSDFLSDLLLCKSSRLTKKMKNAKLSVRSYEFRYPIAPLDVQTLSALQTKFLASITSEPSRLELSFNLTRFWRSRLSNLCVQLGSTLLDGSDWISSLEQMEERAQQAEESIRKARRRRMGLALRKDVKSGKDGVFFSGIPVQRVESNAPKRVRNEGTTDISSTTERSDNSEFEFIQDMLDLETEQPAQVDDFTRILDDLVHGPGMTSSTMPPPGGHMRNNCGPFLEGIISYAEANYLPFQHVDVWVPSFTQNDGKEELRLYHAGYATRTDLDGTMFGQMNEYGEYSTKFSFASGVGLPGRVFATAGVRWERNCHEADPTYFERAGGAKIYGIKTGFGFPLTTKVIGRIVLCFYSVDDVPEDPELASKCCTELSRLCPEPKWKLVVDMAPTSDTILSSMKPRAAGSAQGASVAHYQHGSRADDTSIQSNSTRQSQSIDDEAQLDHRIACLLGDHMPLNELPAPGESSSPSTEPSLLVPHFMSLRLLLLRTPDRRSQEDNDIVDVIRQSFKGYTRDGRRSDKELANLVVQDWQYLRTTAKPPTVAASGAPKPFKVLKRISSDVSASSYHSYHHTANVPSSHTSFLQSSTDSQPYQSHVMDLPPPPQAADAAPVQMPSTLNFLNHQQQRHGDSM